ncbi:XVIPCD domain-containing protein [Dyella jiangningensis]|uniref:X-Tfes XVIPCD domain-containing protein n=1 Tax=Dyella jiangningensis TaxID=1379159 RepID=A0A328P5A5_9GAMM|nr:XVIPCD domain-containing protein [Dyella jiangningensis]RAO75775.1 hypothetical protein CA260_17200 [Dyella jiangningensis]
MTMGTEDYAVLAKDCYQAREIDKDITLNGVHYQAIDYSDDPLTGFQARAYQRMDTSEVIIAFRGTEFDRQPIRDGGVDAGMVLTGINAQTLDALAFTQRVMDQVNALEQRNGHSIPVTVTGHSLGGTLAEIAASRYGLKGETFNAYGAAGLLQGVPEGGHQVIDHVRATDLVSSASPHFGEVRIYAVQQDIDTLTRAGYRDDSTLLSPRNPFKAIESKAHAMDNFVPDSPLLGQSIINPQSQALYRDHKQMIDRYRHDVLDLRTGISAGWETPKAIGDAGIAGGKLVADKAVEGWHAAEHVVHEASEAIGSAAKAVKKEVVHDAHAVKQAVKSAAHATERVVEKAGETVKEGAIRGAHVVGNAAKAAATRAEHAFDNARKEITRDIDAAGKAFHSAGEAVSEKASKLFDTLSHPGSWLDSKPATQKSRLDNEAHPDHALFRQTRSAVHQLDTSHQRAPDQRSDNLAAALTVAARQNGMSQVNHVVLNDDATRAYAVQGDLKSPFKQIAQVDTAQAMATPIEKSSTTWEHQQTQWQTNQALARTPPTQPLQHKPLHPGP